MTNFSIEYNPYMVSCIFKKNDKILNENSKIGAKSNERLQVLLGESVNWKGLPVEIARACDDDEVTIHFKGRRIDFDDLQCTINLYDGPVKFQLDFEESKNDADIISELDGIFEDIRQKNISAFNNKNKDGKDIFTAYEEVKNGIFEVSVIATMSSGKSTLINALLHTELLPSENKACTATICRILDNDDMDIYEAECYASDNSTVVYPRQKITVEEMKAFNSDEKVTYIDIEGSVPAIPSDKIRLCLRDTPGPNNSRDENHERLTKSIIKRTNAVVLYVMNATQIGIKDDEQLLRDISNEMKRTGKQSRDRFIFVINKCDALDEEKGETIDKLLTDVRDYLKKFDIIEPLLIPTSARLALLVRKDRKGDKLSRIERGVLAQVDDFVQSELLHFERYATLTPTVREKLQAQVDEYHADKETWDLEALIHTGVPAVEETICEYIEKYAYPMKIKDAIKDIIAILDELDMKTKFDESIASDGEKLALVRRQIADAKKKHTESKQVYDSYKKKISNFKLDTVSEDNEQFSVEMELQRMLKDYDGKTKVDKVEADSMIASFQEKLEKYQKKCESRLNTEIDNRIFHKCEEMLADYTAMIRSILENIEIEGFDFKKINKFDKIKISNINDIKKKNEETRYRAETRWKDNPERQGFLGTFKFWKPKEISYTVSVKDGIDVNVKNIIVDIMSVFSASIKENISSMFNQAEEQISDYKLAFNENIDTLEGEITKILDQLDQNTKESKSLEKRVKENKELAVWVANKEAEIRRLLTF